MDEGIELIQKLIRLRPKGINGISLRDILRFYSQFKMRSDEECWEWTGALRQRETKDIPAYGTIKIKGKNLYAHRLSWMIHRGPIPEGIFTCHICDFCKCVNFHHLFLGTAAENNWDRINKGR